MRAPPPTAGIVFFSTAERMVTGDTDSREDVFERSKDAAAGGEYVTREVSIGPTGGHDAYDAFYKGSSANGQRVFFATRESLVPQDTDQAFDIYMREIDENATTLISQADSSCTAGTCGNGSQDASVVPGGVVANGNRVFFGTTEALASEDQDGGVSDIYVRNIATGTALPSSRVAILPAAVKVAETAPLRRSSKAHRTTASASSSAPMKN